MQAQQLHFFSSRKRKLSSLFPMAASAELSSIAHHLRVCVGLSILNKGIMLPQKIKYCISTANPL